MSVSDDEELKQLDDDFYEILQGDVPVFFHGREGIDLTVRRPFKEAFEAETDKLQSTIDRLMYRVQFLEEAMQSVERVKKIKHA